MYTFTIFTSLLLKFSETSLLSMHTIYNYLHCTCIRMLLSSDFCKTILCSSDFVDKTHETIGAGEGRSTSGPGGGRVGEGLVPQTPGCRAGQAEVTGKEFV